MAKRANRVRITPSSGNVFEDLGLPNAQQELTKVRLAVSISRILAHSGLSQVAAARRLKINQPKVSALLNYKLDGFSVERLIRFLNALDRDVEIVIRKKAHVRGHGRVLVSAA